MPSEIAGTPLPLAAVRYLNHLHDSAAHPRLRPRRLGPALALAFLSGLCGFSTETRAQEFLGAQKILPSNTTMVLVHTDIPDVINTDALAECWRGAVRGTPAWLNTGDLGADKLERLVGRGGINVRVEVIGNRINTKTLELAGATLPETTEMVEPTSSGASDRLSRSESEEVYKTATRALSKCGANEVPQPNGVYAFTFDPGMDGVPVTPLKNEHIRAPTTMIAPAIASGRLDLEPLTSCWMREIRNARNWDHSGDRSGDTLAHFYGKGGVGVRLVVENNRLDTAKLHLMSATGDGTYTPIKSSTIGNGTGLDYWDAQDIYSSAFKAMTQCGFLDSALPDGSYQLIFDPARESIMAITY